MDKVTYGSTCPDDDDYDPKLVAIKRQYDGKPVSLQSALIAYQQEKSQQQSKAEDGLDKQTLAVAVLVEHPEWSDTRVAEAIGVSRTTLYKSNWATYQKTRRLIRARSPRLKGSKKDGSIEAVDPNSEK